MRPLFLGNSLDIDECMSDGAGAHGVCGRSAGSHSDKDAVLQQHIQQEQGQVQAAKVPTLFLPKVAQIQPLLEKLGSLPCDNSFTTKCSQGDDCAGSHATTTCSKGKEIEATCANCKGSHVASYKGCPIYKPARDKLLSSRVVVRDNQPM
ncbi:GH11530 [Drosophila grimshawi]|uniref:GH11530 n=1 Tax=Drosophila grimshawi TaxID=7222 RepID=B4K0F2_DROGR|nr:GH11530 [Drosophila grimshawi]